MVSLESSSQLLSIESSSDSSSILALDVDVVAKAEGRGVSVTPKWYAKRVINSASHLFILVGSVGVDVEGSCFGAVDVINAGAAGVGCDGEDVVGAGSFGCSCCYFELDLALTRI